MLTNDVAELDWVLVLSTLVLEELVELVAEELAELVELVLVVAVTLEEYCKVTLVTFTSRYLMVLLAAGGSAR